MIISIDCKSTPADLTLINWLEASLLAVVEANAELDLRDCALAKVSNRAGA